MHNVISNRWYAIWESLLYRDYQWKSKCRFYIIVDKFQVQSHETFVSSQPNDADWIVTLHRPFHLFVVLMIIYRIFSMMTYMCWKHTKKQRLLLTLHAFEHLGLCLMYFALITCNRKLETQWYNHNWNWKIICTFLSTIATSLYYSRNWVMLLQRHSSFLEKLWDISTEEASSISIENATNKKQ